MQALLYNTGRKVIANVTIPKFFGIVSFVLGLLVCIGWIYNINILTTFFPSYPDMKFNSALCFIFAGSSIIFYYLKANKLFYSFAIATFLIGLLTLIQYLFKIDFYIDEIFIADKNNISFGSYPGRMSLSTALAFSVIGFALIFNNTKNKLVIYFIEIFKIIIFYIAVFAFIGYLFHIQTLQFFNQYNYISLPTSIGIILLIAALYLLDERNLYNKILWNKGSGGLLVRLLIPLSLSLPILSGLLIFNSALFSEDAHLAITIYVFLIIFTFTSVIWYSGYKLYSFDNQLVRLTQELFEKSNKLEEANETLISEIEKSKNIANKLYASEAKYVTVTENVSDLISILDKEGNYLFLSNACSNLIGYNSDELLHTKIFNLIHPDYRIAFEPLFQQILEGNEVGIVIFKIKTKNNDYIWFESNFKLSEIDGESVLIAVSRDVSKRIKAEEALKENAQKLEIANRELQAFSYSVSHDLRAPLRSITGFSRILMEEYEANLDDEGRRLLNKIISNSNKMGQLIDDLLAFSRWGRQEKVESNIDIEAVIIEASNEILQLYPERKIHFNIKNPPSAYGDKAMLTQVINNLLSNAVKYTGYEKEAMIEIGGTESKNFIEYYIKDNGAGFEMAYADKLFGVFQRLHTLEEFEGTGIGLALVKRIIDRHGGKVWAEGTVGEGATFYFTLPKKNN